MKFVLLQDVQAINKLRSCRKSIGQAMRASDNSSDRERAIDV